MSSSSTPQRAPKKKNAASQFRSRRKRVSHPLMDPAHAPSPSTPPREDAGLGGAIPAAIPVTPEHPSLLNALEMAARPSPTKEGGSAIASAATPPSSYASSIEAMAKAVESKRRRRTPPRKSSSSSRSPPMKLRKRASSGGSRSSSGGSRSKSQGGRKTNVARPQSKVWLVAVPVLLSFLACECLIWLLVFRFKDAVATSTGDGDALRTLANVDLRLSSLETEIEGKGEQDIVVAGTDEMASSSPDDAAPVATQSVEDGAEEDEGVGEADAEPQVQANDELSRLQSMLEEGFTKLRGLSGESQGELSKTLVQSLCGNVWLTANKMLSSESLEAAEGGNASGIQPSGSGEMTLEKMSQLDANPWKTMALDAQHCLGGAGLAFLTRDVDSARVRISTKIFDRLMYVDPHDPNVRAGLGTALLIQGIFDDDGSSSGTEHTDDAQYQLFALATYHLKVASTLFSTSQRTAVEAGRMQEVPTDNSSAAAAISEWKEVDNQTSSSHAAILHNLALAYIALGDNQKSVPVLLRAAALRREHHTDTKTYWNAPSDVLQLAEEKALLLAAKNKTPSKPKKNGLPFFR